MHRRPALWLTAAALALALAACGGDEDPALEIPEVTLQDPRSAPTATPPAALPTPVDALDVTALPEVGGGTPAAGETPEASPTPQGGGGQPEPSPTPAGDVYVVQDGDNLVTIAQRLGVEYEALCRANDIDPENPRAIYVGEELKVPEG